MARASRNPAPGIYHLTAHSIWSATLFRDDVDRTLFLRELVVVAERPRWSCIAVCLMTTHFHLVAEFEDDSMPIVMHQLNSRFAQKANARHRQRGHLFADRYASTPIESEGHLLTAFRYVARNPVTAGLCRSPAEWAWSSYSCLVNGHEGFGYVDISRVLGCFGNSSPDSFALLSAFVEAA